MRICDGCNVNGGHEHRCHGDSATVGGERTGLACECPGCTPPNEYNMELSGVCVLGPMTRSMREFARAVRVSLEREQEKPLPDNSLAALLCDAARLGWEYRQLVQPEIGLAAAGRAWEFVRKNVIGRLEGLDEPGQRLVTFGQLRDELAAEFERVALEARRAALES